MYCGEAFLISNHNIRYHLEVRKYLSDTTSRLELLHIGWQISLYCSQEMDFKLSEYVDKTMKAQTVLLYS